MGKNKPRPRRSFTPEFKAEIVKLCRRGDRSVGQIAKDFDLTETAVRLWVNQAEVDAGEPRWPDQPCNAKGRLRPPQGRQADAGGRSAGPPSQTAAPDHDA
ncbi:transposase [Streptomyces sp. DT203]|uniref:transposase n=1 Tax=Streptomyces sp. DT203 TaxID=3393424 RepID=UPI003CF0DCCB